MNVANKMRVGGEKSTASGALLGVLLALAAISSTGCTSIVSPIRGIPVRMLPPQFLWRPRSQMIPLELYRLTRNQPKEYELDAGDLLAVFIEGVTGEPEAVVPTHFPEKGSDLAPVSGYPFPIRDDGTISLPLIPAIDVRGMTLTKLEERVREEYTVKRKILVPGRDRITIGLIKERTTRVIVVRADQSITSGMNNNMMGNAARNVVQGSDESGQGFVLDLKAYKNDLMNALAESGGLPGLRAKNEVKILRRAKADPEKREMFIRDFYAQHSQDPCLCPPPLPEDPSTTLVPLRYYPEEMPDLREEDIILNEGDIVYIESRDAELFYTGGMLQGGQYPLPRDYDLDVLGAMGIAGFGPGSLNPGGGGGGIGGFGVGSLGGASPSNLFIIRKTPCNQQITIKINLIRAIQDPRENILVAPGDTLILRYKPREELLNFGIAAFFAYGISYFFSKVNN